MNNKPHKTKTSHIRLSEAKCLLNLRKISSSTGDDSEKKVR